MVVVPVFGEHGSETAWAIPLPPVSRDRVAPQIRIRSRTHHCLRWAQRRGAQCRGHPYLFRRPGDDFREERDSAGPIPRVDDASRKWVDELDPSFLEVLLDHPEIGYSYQSSSRQVRILMYGHYRIAYLAKESGNINILGVFHGSLDISRYSF